MTLSVVYFYKNSFMKIKKEEIQLTFNFEDQLELNLN
jgi:hypothetical protein